MGQILEWWERERNLSTKEAKKILLPCTEEWKSYERGKFLVPLSWGTIIVGGGFIIAELIFGNKEPLWGILVASLAIILFIAAAIMYLFVHKRDMINALRHYSYRGMFEEILAKKSNN